MTDAARGPSTSWSTLAGGGRVAATETASDRRSQEWAGVRDYLDGLFAAHDVPVRRAVRPIAPSPAAPTRRAVRRELRRAAVAGLPWWRVTDRLSARAHVERRLDAEVARRETVVRAALAAAQAEADVWWERLLANDPDTVIQHLDRALAAHAMPATVTAVEEDRAHVVVPVLTVEKLIGPREPTTSAGRPALARLTKTRRHELYAAAIASAMTAVAAEIFALAPGIQAVAIAVVAPEHLGGPAVLVLAELGRELVLPDGADRAATNDLLTAAEAGRATLVRDKGSRLGALRPLDEATPEIRGLLEVLDTA